MTTNIQKSAVLVRLSISRWAGEKTDRAVTEEVTAAKKAESKAGRFVKSLFAGNSLLKEIKQVAGKARNTNADQTLPYVTGQYLLPISNFQHHGEVMKSYKDIFDGLVTDFLSTYERARDAQQLSLGAMFDQSDYPSVDELRAKFDFSLSYEPMPDNNTFDSMLGSEELEKQLIDAAEADLQSRIDDATRALWQRLETCLDRIATTLPKYEPADVGMKAVGTFRDTLIENARDLCDVLPRLNLTGDADLNNYCQQVKDKIAVYDAQDLREDAVLRKNVADEASSILGQMAGYGVAA